MKISACGPANCSLRDEYPLARMDKLKQKGNLSNLVLAGLRLGGTLAMMAAENRKDVNGVILWEPVVNGRKFLKELNWLQSRYIESMHREYRRLYKGNPSLNEILGFDLTSSLTKDLKKLDLMSQFRLQNNDILFLLNESTFNYNGFLDFLINSQNKLTLKVVEEQMFWLERPYKALVPVRSIRTIISWLSNRVK